MFSNLDGISHQQDMLGSSLRYLLCDLSPNLLLVVAIGPAILAGLAVCRQVACWPMSFLLWVSVFGRRKVVLKRLEMEFVGWFRYHVTASPVVHARLMVYLTSTDADVWLVIGSSRSLVEQVYRDTPWLPRVNLVANRTARRQDGWVLTLRYLRHEKVVQLEKRIGVPLRLYGDYSSSKQDNPLLGFCQHR